MKNNKEQINEQIIISTILQLYETCGWDSFKEGIMSAYTKVENIINKEINSENIEDIMIRRIQNIMRVVEILINMKLNDIIIPEDRLKYKALTRIFIEKLMEIMCN